MDQFSLTQQVGGIFGRAVGLLHHWIFDVSAGQLSPGQIGCELHHLFTLLATSQAIFQRIQYKLELFNLMF